MPVTWDTIGTGGFGYSGITDNNPILSAIDNLGEQRKMFLKENNDLLKTFHELDLNEQEYQDGGIVPEYMQKFDNVMANFKSNGNSAEAYNDLIEISREMYSDPNLIGRIFANREYNNFRKSVENNKTLTEGLKNYILDTNPYYYYSGPVNESTGERGIGSEWKPKNPFVDHKSMIDILTDVAGRISRNTGIFEGNNFTDDDGNVYNMAFVRDGNLWAKTDAGQFEMVTGEKLQTAVKAVINSSPELQESVRQDYKYEWYKYNNAVKKQNQNPNDSLSDEEQASINALTENGSILSYDAWLSRKIDPYCNIYSFIHVSLNTPQSKKERYYTGSHSSRTSNNSGTSKNSGKATHIISTPPPIKIYKGTTGEGDDEDEDEELIIDDASIGQSRIRPIATGGESIEGGAMRFGGRRKALEGTVVATSENEDETEENNEANTRIDNNATSKIKSIYPTYSYSVGHGTFMKDDYNILLNARYDAERHAMSLLQNSMYFNVADDSIRQFSTLRDMYDYCIDAGKASDSKTAKSYISNLAFNTQGSTDYNNFRSLNMALYAYNHNDSLINKMINDLGHEQAFNFLNDVNSATWNPKNSEGSRKITDLLTNAFSNDNVITYRLGDDLKEKLTRIYNVIDLTQVEGLNIISDSEGTKVKFSAENQNIYPLFCSNLQKAFSQSYSHEQFFSTVWRKMKHLVGYYGGKPQNHEYTIEQTSNNDPAGIDRSSLHWQNFGIPGHVIGGTAAAIGMASLSLPAAWITVPAAFGSGAKIGGAITPDSMSENADEINGKMARLYDHYNKKYNDEIDKIKSLTKGVMTIESTNYQIMPLYSIYNDPTTTQSQKNDLAAKAWNDFVTHLRGGNFLTNYMEVADNNGTRTAVTNPVIYSQLLNVVADNLKLTDCVYFRNGVRVNSDGRLNYGEGHQITIDVPKNFSEQFQRPDNNDKELVKEAEKIDGKVIKLYVEGIYGNDPSTGYRMQSRDGVGYALNQWQIANSTNMNMIPNGGYMPGIGDTTIRKNDDGTYYTEAFGATINKISKDTAQKYSEIILQFDANVDNMTSLVSINGVSQEIRKNFMIIVTDTAYQLANLLNLNAQNVYEGLMEYLVYCASGHGTINSSNKK